MGTGQLLFAEEELPWRPAYDANAVRVRLQDMLIKMRAAAPWKSATVDFYRENLWPSLLEKIAQTDAVRLRAEIEAEIARLDAAT